MTNYQQKSYKIPKNKIKEIIAEVIASAQQIWADELDCAKSLARQATSKSIQEVLEIGLNNKSTHWNFIFRPPISTDDSPFFDVGCSTIGLKPDYFLWIKLSVKNGEKLIKKYKLKPRI